MNLSGERAEREYRRLIGPHDDARHGHLTELRSTRATGTNLLGLDIVHVVHTGQSLSTGLNGTPVLSTTEAYGNLALADSSGVFDITNPYASTLSLGSSAAPVRPLNGGAVYPQNLSGEVSDTRFMDQMVRLASAAGITCKMSSSNVGFQGSPMYYIDKGGNLNCYAASLYEATALHRLATIAGKAFGPGVVLLTHGEQDAAIGTSRASYAALVQLLQQNYQSDLNAIAGTIGAVPLIACQNTQLPYSGGGLNTTASAVLDAMASGLVLVSGPKYNYTFPDQLHLTNTQYQLLGEKYAQVYWSYLRTGKWLPLYPTSFVVAGSGSSTTITITFNVPVGPLQWDLTQGTPHQSGAFSAWASGKGFEVEDTFLPGIPTNVTNASPMQVTWPSHGRSTGDVINLQNILMSVNSASAIVNATWTITVVDANNFTLNGSSAPGGTFASATYAIGGKLVPISSAVISGNTVILTLGRSMTAGAILGYAQTPDVVFGTNGGGFQGGAGRCGNLRDSDTFAGISGVAQPNWACAFYQAVT